MCVTPNSSNSNNAIDNEGSPRIGRMLLLLLLLLLLFCGVLLRSCHTCRFLSAAKPNNIHPSRPSHPSHTHSLSLSATLGSP